MHIDDNPDAVFEAAIGRGFFVYRPAVAQVYLWMYMFHDDDGTAWFKHAGSGQYLVMPAAVSGPGAGNIVHFLCVVRDAAWENIAPVLATFVILS